MQTSSSLPTEAASLDLATEVERIVADCVQVRRLRCGNYDIPKATNVTISFDEKQCATMIPGADAQIIFEWAPEEDGKKDFCEVAA